MVKKSVENKTNRVFASNRHSRFRRLVRSLGKRLSTVGHTTANVNHFLADFKWVYLIGLFAAYIFICMPTALILIPMYGFFWGVASIATFFSPTVFLVARKMWRESHMKPMLDGVELSTEAQMKALEEYIKLLEKQTNKSE